jgi:glycogen operon protein
VIRLGATCEESGTTFALWSGVAEEVRLSLFDDRDGETTVRLEPAGDGVWAARVAGVGPGQRYGFRVHGPWDPAGSGARCDPARLLLDPWARAISGRPAWRGSLFPPESPYASGDASTPAGADTAPHVPRSVVVDSRFDWGDDAPPGVPLEATVIYEAHVKGFTARHPGVPPPLRGTYAGLAHPAAIDHLVGLGITAVELLPIHQFIHEPRLEKLGLRNYWGYASVGFFAPHGEYAAAGDGGGQVREFQAMVRALHQAGLEVILDVVYNHTGEGDAAGPILAFKGIDNAAYYRLMAGDPERYVDDTATGNTLDTRQPIVRRLILDSLRYWIDVMHVDGFRFDLAATLGRESDEFDPAHPLLEAIRTDPVISRVKLIAEPWDAGPGGYQPGRFPPPFGEWNDRFRDTARDLWRGALPAAAELGHRLTGSADRFAASGRGPAASVNFVTAHDGFTLADLVAYERKRNEANGEANRDGTDENHSWNHGLEGPTEDPAVAGARRRTQRNLLATLFLAQGVPMLLAGDELGRTQGGNNNAYNQDNETSWLDWPNADEELLGFVRRLIALRGEHPALRRRHWLGEESGHAADWFRLDGAPMTPADWERGPFEGIALRLAGDAGGSDCDDATCCLVINALPEPRAVTLPPSPAPAGWLVTLDTARAEPFPTGHELATPAQPLLVAARSLVVLVAGA